MGFSLTQTGSELAIYDDASDTLLATGAEDGAGVTAAEVAWEVDFTAVQRLRTPGCATIEGPATVTEQGSVVPGIQAAYSLLTGSDPNLTSDLTIIDHGASPVTWDAGNGDKDYSITIQTTTTAGDNFTEAQLLEEINYSISSVNMYFGFRGFDWPDMIIQAGTTIETARGRLFGSTGAVLKGVRVIKSDGVTAHPAVSRHQADDATYGQAPTAASALVDSIVPNSQLRVVNATTGVTLVNTTITGTQYLASYTNGTDYTSGDFVTIRLTQVDGITAKNEFTTTTQANSEGWTILAAQEDNLIYNALALDGASYNTKFVADYNNDEVDIIVNGNFKASEFYAWWVANLATSQGIADFFGGVTALDEANFRINNDVVNIFLDNATTVNEAQLDNRRIFRADGIRPVVEPTSGGGGIDVEWRSPVTIARSETIQQALVDIYTDTQRVDALIEDSGGDQFTAKALNQAPSGGGGVGTNVNVVSVGGTSVSSVDDFKADVSGLSTFDPASDTVANVGTVQTTITNNDMVSEPANTTIANIYTDTQRVDGLIEDVGGDLYTSKALEEAPSGGGGGTDVNVISVGGTSVSGPDALKADVSGLSTFDPATDTVANVGTVQTTITNSDMVSEPDNAGIVANGNAIAALNDFDPATDTVANVGTVQTTITNSDMVSEPNNAGIVANGNAIAALNDFDPATDTVANVGTVQTTITNSDMVSEPDNTTIASIYTDTQRVDGLIEDDNGDQLTTKALSQAPSGGGDNSDVLAEIETVKARQQKLNEGLTVSSKFKTWRGSLPT